MRRIAMIVTLALGLGACSGGSPEGPTAGVAAPAVLSASALPRMDSVASEADAEAIAGEVAHPDELIAVLDGAGFARSRERSFTTGTGAFSRVVARGLAFETDAGAGDYLAWFSERAGEEIVTAERIELAPLPAGLVVFRHLPDGCCHNDVPVFLAAWQRGSTVLTLHAGGRKANASAFAELVVRLRRGGMETRRVPRRRRRDLGGGLRRGWGLRSGPAGQFIAAHGAGQCDEETRP